MNGGNRTFVTRNPLSRPAKAPVTKPSRSAIGPGTPKDDSGLRHQNDDSTITAPTERSMPAVKMISVWPTARAPTTATCCVIRDRFAG